MATTDTFKTAIVELLKPHVTMAASELEAKIEIPADDALGDYAFPCFFLTKAMKKSPVAIAMEIAAAIGNDTGKSKLIERVQAVGPYVNFFANKTALAAAVIEAVEKERSSYGMTFLPKNPSRARHDWAQSPKGDLGVNQKTVMVEYFHANTHKAVHIGHVRNICLGESLCRILE
ncbi:arginine--tRNA ligase, partial [Candidatus Woesearchaeota archaeon]|nr:arginine--tRNA ligase [Candidatus Woesearchaeota archaeon]